MSVETETCADILEQKVTTLSPSMQSDLSTDGDGSTNQNNSSSNDKFSLTSANSQPVSCEPKVKKRRKQSNPLKIQNATSPKFDVSSYELSEQNETEANSVTSYFVNEELINQNHVTETSKVSDLSQTSQKGSLSKVTNALYNNKIKEAAKVNKVANKSKESSLSSCQSITDISSPESSEEITSNNEYKHSLQFPQMPPLLPMNPVEINDTSKLSVVPYPFSEFPSSIPQGNSLSITHRSFITSSGVRVFNPEAYCELCEKEFCNKYFLKTHKANKHGICSVDNNHSGHNYRQYKNVHMSPQNTQQMINQMCENGAMFGSADSYCNICQKYFCNKYFLKKHRQNIHGIHENPELPATPSSIHVPVISSPLPLVRPALHETKSAEVSSGQPTKDEESKINVSLENIKNSLNTTIPLLNGSSPHTSSQSKTNVTTTDTKEKKNEKFLCELCNIEFCDKCYLDAHRQNKHGMAKISTAELPENSEGDAVEVNEKSGSPPDSDEPKDNFKGQMCAPCMKTFTTAEAFQNHMLEVHIASVKDEDDVSRMSDTVNKKTVLSGLEKDILRVDKSPAMQEIENSNSSNESGSFNCNFCLMKCKDRSSYITHMETEHSVLELAGSDSGQDNVFPCTTCQEQFPDRLTLMSHKFKSHGITSLGMEEHMENGDFAYLSGMRQKSGTSSFCQICNKELCNKYFMKTHMMKMHGIGMDKIQQERWTSPSGSGVYCDICNKLLCSKYFLKIHKQNVHRIIDDSPKLSVVGSPMYSNNSGVNIKKIEKNYPAVGMLNHAVVNDAVVGKEEPVKNKVFTCDLCGQEFPNKLLLQVHLVDKHVKCNDSKGSNSSILSNLYSPLPDETKDAKRLPCPCCLFVNLGDNLKVELGQELRMISCMICNITYQQSDYHAHHLSHGIALPPGKKINLENGVHEPGIDYSNSGNTFDPNNKNKMRPRKFKRFRCSKCDKTFRTKIKCLHHIQVMHKSKKSLLNPCDQQTPSKKAAVNHVTCKKNSEVKVSSGTENGSGLISGKDAKDAVSLLSSGFHEAAPLPVPYVLPKNSDVIMQPFHLSEPKPEGVTKQDIFVPSLVYLPVSQKVSEPVTVAFTLTPA